MDDQPVSGRTLVRALVVVPQSLNRRRVVGNRRHEAAVVRPLDADGDPRRRPAAHRRVERLADDLVQRRLHLLAEQLGRGDIDVDLDLAREPDLVREPADGRLDPLVAQHDRLEAERQLAQRADRVAMPVERLVQNRSRGLEVPVVDRVPDGVQHERDPRKSLHGSVVEEQREAPALVLLCGDQLLGEPGALCSFVVPH